LRASQISPGDKEKIASRGENAKTSRKIPILISINNTEFVFISNFWKISFVGIYNAAIA
jgi:hypothetical protein